VHGTTLVAPRDPASLQIRVNTIAPGVFDAPMLARLRQDIPEGPGGVRALPEAPGGSR
jgi:NAD(P)-dependent dehydrogenase (short-subunit alcohol dehydrogenase family)